MHLLVFFNFIVILINKKYYKNAYILVPAISLIFNPDLLIIIKITG